jgi:hypothetical protein
MMGLIDSAGFNYENDWLNLRVLESCKTILYVLR